MVIPSVVKKIQQNGRQKSLYTILEFNSLQEGAADVHVYVLEDSIGVIVLQEAGARTGSSSARGCRRSELLAVVTGEVQSGMSTVYSCHAAFGLQG